MIHDFCGDTISIIQLSYYSLRSEITCIQLIILTFRRDQLIMRTSLDDASLLHDHDTVGVLDCRQTMAMTNVVRPFISASIPACNQFLGTCING